MISLGNSNVSEAEIICFGETHGDRLFRETITQQINASYQEGDIILVEGVKASEIVGNKTQWTEHLKPGCFVRGWEPENLEELNPLGERAEKLKDELYSFKEYMESISEKKELNEAEKVEIKAGLEKFK